MPFARRVERLRRSLEELDLQALLVTSLKNIRYLSGFSGSSGLALFTADEAFLITDFRYRIQVAGEARGVTTVEQKGAADKFLASFLSRFRFRRFGFESSASFDFARKLRRMARPALIKPTENLVEHLRMVKDEEEVAAMERLAGVTDRSFTEFLELLKPGMTEKRAAMELECRLRENGSDPPPFPIIVAAGENGAMPHARASERVIGEGEPIIVDFGASGGGYATDVTRTLCFGRAADDIAKLYRLVYDAQKSALSAVRPGAEASEVDAAARSVIAAAGLGVLFGHSTGHGVGLDVHEGPGLSPESRERLATGMVVTVEPGIYVEGLGGVRIEDMALVTDEGCRVLTAGVPKAREISRP